MGVVSGCGPSVYTCRDRRLLYPAGHPICLPKPTLSTSCALVALLLLSAAVEPNLSQINSLRYGQVNARSAVHKAAQLRDIIADNAVDIVAITEM